MLVWFRMLVEWMRAQLERPGKSQKGLAVALGVDPSAVSKMLSKTRRISAEELPRIAQYFGTAIPMGARKENDFFEFYGDTYSAVDIVNVAVAAGDGVAFDDAGVNHRALFRTQWLRTITSTPPKDLAVVTVSGDSMWETLHHGDTVLMDRRVNRVSVDGIYVISWKGETDWMVKRIQRDPRTRLVTIKSDNPTYQSWTGVADDDFTVHGRVVWLGRNIGG